MFNRDPRTRHQARLAQTRAAEEEPEVNTRFTRTTAAEQEAEANTRFTRTRAAEEEPEVNTRFTRTRATEQEAEVNTRFTRTRAAEQEADVNTRFTRTRAAEQEAEVNTRFTRSRGAPQEAEVHTRSAKTKVTEEADVNTRFTRTRGAGEEAELNLGLIETRPAEQEMELNTALARMEAIEEAEMNMSLADLRAAEQEAEAEAKAADAIVRNVKKIQSSASAQQVKHSETERIKAKKGPVSDRSTKQEKTDDPPKKKIRTYQEYRELIGSNSHDDKDYRKLPPIPKLSSRPAPVTQDDRSSRPYNSEWGRTYPDSRNTTYRRSGSNDAPQRSSSTTKFNSPLDSPVKDRRSYEDSRKRSYPEHSNTPTETPETTHTLIKEAREQLNAENLTYAQRNALLTQLDELEKLQRMKLQYDIDNVVNSSTDGHSSQTHRSESQQSQSAGQYAHRSDRHSAREPQGPYSRDSQGQHAQGPGRRHSRGTEESYARGSDRPHDRGTEGPNARGTDRSLDRGTEGPNARGSDRQYNRRTEGPNGRGSDRQYNRSTEGQHSQGPDRPYTGSDSRNAWKSERPHELVAKDQQTADIGNRNIMDSAYQQKAESENASGGNSAALPNSDRKAPRSILKNPSPQKSTGARESESASKNESRQDTSARSGKSLDTNPGAPGRKYEESQAHPTGHQRDQTTSQQPQRSAQVQEQPDQKHDSKYAHPPHGRPRQEQVSSRLAQGQATSHGNAPYQKQGSPHDPSAQAHHYSHQASEPAQTSHNPQAPRRTDPQHGHPGSMAGQTSRQHTHQGGPQTPLQGQYPSHASTTSQHGNQHPGNSQTSSGRPNMVGSSQEQDPSYLNRPPKRPHETQHVTLGTGEKLRLPDSEQQKSIPQVSRDDFTKNQPVPAPWYDTNAIYCPDHDARWSVRIAKKNKEDLHVCVGKHKILVPRKNQTRSISLGQHGRCKVTVNFDSSNRTLYVDNKPFYKIGEEPKKLDLADGSSYLLHMIGPQRNFWIDGKSYELYADAPPDVVKIAKSEHKMQIDSEKNMVIVQGYDICPADGPPKEIALAYVCHEIRFTPPQKKILIDNNFCELDLVAKIPYIIMKDIAHGISFDGPPRDMFINGDMFIVHMDRPSKVKIPALGDKLVSLAFGGPGHEVIINEEWYEIKFGGLPKDIKIGSKILTVEIKGQPPDVKILGEFLSEDQIRARVGHPKDVTKVPPQTTGLSSQSAITGPTSVASAQHPTAPLPTPAQHRPPQFQSMPGSNQTVPNSRSQQPIQTPTPPVPVPSQPTPVVQQSAPHPNQIAQGPRPGHPLPGAPFPMPIPIPGQPFPLPLPGQQGQTGHVPLPGMPHVPGMPAFPAMFPHLPLPMPGTPGVVPGMVPGFPQHPGMPQHPVTHTAPSVPQVSHPLLQAPHTVPHAVQSVQQTPHPGPHTAPIVPQTSYPTPHTAPSVPQTSHPVPAAAPARPPVSQQQPQPKGQSKPKVVTPMDVDALLSNLVKAGVIKQ